MTPEEAPSGRHLELILERVHERLLAQIKREDAAQRRRRFGVWFATIALTAGLSTVTSSVLAGDDMRDPLGMLPHHYELEAMPVSYERMPIIIVDESGAGSDFQIQVQTGHGLSDGQLGSGSLTNCEPAEGEFYQRMRDWEQFFAQQQDATAVPPAPIIEAADDSQQSPMIFGLAGSRPARVTLFVDEQLGCIVIVDQEPSSQRSGP